LAKSDVFSLGNSEYVELCALLKAVGPMLTGGEAKQVIISGKVTVDQGVETRKKCKIRRGQVVEFNDFKITVG
jgi:ribosome-associated protein